MKSNIFDVTMYSVIEVFIGETASIFTTEK
jgi:hypothetical protein